MKNQAFFKAESRPGSNKVIIKVDFDKLKKINGMMNEVSGSYTVLQSRVLGMNHVDYLKMCRDEFGAELVGREKLYPVAYFEKGEKLHLLLKMLNEYMNVIYLALKQKEKGIELI